MTTPHPDIDTLAERHAGLLDPAAAADVDTHLTECSDCRAVVAALDEVQALLRDEGDLSADRDRAPQDVVRRLDDALAAEAAPVATAASNVTPLHQPNRAPWHTRALQAAAVFVLLAAVGGLGYGGLKALNSGGNSAGGDSAASGTGGGQAQADGKGARGYQITNSGRNYTDTSLRAAVPELLAGSLRPLDRRSLSAAGSGEGEPEDSASSPPAGPQRLTDGAALAACVANLMGGPVTPLAVDLGKFDGMTATIIVVTDPDDPAFVDVFAVAPECPTGTFLKYDRVALP